MPSQPHANVDPAAAPFAPLPPSVPQCFGLAALLVILATAAGVPSIDSPWMPGDEYVFIVRNPDVNPAADALEPPGGLARRLWRIVTTVHEDLYQPLPILTYAIEWTLSGGSGATARRTDVAIHVVNALLVWAVLSRILVTVANVAWTRMTATLAWAGAALWTVHPVLSTAYAADMGRTHLMSATFSLAALLALLSATERPRDSAIDTARTLLALLLAMLSKPVAGWILPAVVLYAGRRGVTRTIRSPLIWATATLCAGFALLTIRTSAEAGLIEDISKGLFGDPITRSAYGVYLYARNTLLPTNLLFWYAPDPDTGWAYWPVWIGLLIVAATLIAAVRAGRQPSQRYVCLGWAWCWGHLLPVIGLVSAREAAATDRYLYQPLIGGILILVIAIARRAHAARPLAGGHLPLLAGTLASVILLALTLPAVRVFRSPLLRAERVVAVDPDDPRAYEALAAAYNFAQNRPLPRDDAARVPAATTATAFFRELTVATLLEAARQPRLEHYFPGIDDRAPFHRRISYRLLMNGCPEPSLEQAEIARALQPDAFNTWRRLAQANRALGHLSAAIAAYQRAEDLLPDDVVTRRVHLAEFGDLLIGTSDRDRDACPKFAAALALAPPARLAEPAVWREAGALAMLGMARCHIRFGHGADGFAIVRQILAADPTRAQAWLVAGEYHLRSQHFDQAVAAYGEVVRNHPTHYEALRGYHEALFQADRMPEAIAAWRAATDAAPEDLRLKGFLVWAYALSGDARTPEVSQAILAADADNVFGCLAMGLDAWRAGGFDAALEWIERATRGHPDGEARAFDRAAAAVRVLRRRGVLGPESLVLEAAIYAWGPFPGAVRRASLRELGAVDGSGWSAAARAALERVARRLSDVSGDGV